MAKINQNEIRKDISKHLSSAENLKSIAVFKKVPSTGKMMLTRGMAWSFARQFYIGATDRHLIIVPRKANKIQARMGEDVIFAKYDEIDFYLDNFNNVILNLKNGYQGKPMKLRLRSGYQIEGMDQLDFIAAVKAKKQAHD